MRTYRHLFFDLDRTLWDFETNARAAFSDLVKKFKLTAVVGCSDVFFETFNNHNEKLWTMYRKGDITKERLKAIRFGLTLNEFGINDNELGVKLGIDYLNISVTKTALIPHTHETLSALKPAYNLHIITNGFNEVQFFKMENSNLSQYFDKVITSEAAGALKPRKEIFDFALEQTNAKRNESLMIGDDLETDIKGAANAGIDQVFLNLDGVQTNGNITHEIESLHELINMLIE